MIDDPLLVDDWHPVAKSFDLPEGAIHSARLLGEDLVLWRVNGIPRAFQDLCIHRGTRLSLGRITGDLLVCAYHGWTYNADGGCVRIPAHPEQTPPAKARVRTYRAIERYDLVWVSLGSPADDPPKFPEWHDPSFETFVLAYGPFKAAAPRAIENFLDVGHLAILHAGVLGDPANAAISDYEVSLDSDGLSTSSISIPQPAVYPSQLPDSPIYHYRCLRPLAAYLEKQTDKGVNLSILYVAQPHDESTTTAYVIYAVERKWHTTLEDLKRFNDPVMAQDIMIVESQRPELLPLDLQAELHLRSDRTAIAYRRWLRELGITFGTA